MPTIGDLLNGRYRIKNVIGQGGMGRVYLADDISFGEESVEVAVKENLQKEAKEQFLREAAILARLRHAGLPKVTDHFLDEEGSQYLVMEYVPGMDLREYVINHGTFTSEETATLGIRVCHILEYLHSQDPSVIHRDIKPSNLKWAHSRAGVSREKQRKETSVVLIDFGIVKVGGAQEQTRVGGHGVSRGYSPIEQDPDVGSEHTNERSDIYALGATLFFLATGENPPVSTVRIAEDTLDAEMSDVDPALRSVIRKAMAVVSQDRYPSAEEFRLALEELFTQKPFLLEDVSVEDGSAVLHWTLGEETDFESYEIHASESAEFTPSQQTLVETVTQCDTTTISLRGLRKNTEHHLRVRLRMQSGRSRTSNTLSARIPFPPPSPITLESPESRRRSVALQWSPTLEPSYFQKYEVHSARIPGFTISEATLNTSTGEHSKTKRVIGGLEPKTPYYFKIRAVNVDGQETVSNEQLAQAKPPRRIRPGPIGLFALAMFLGALLITILNPRLGSDSWQNLVTRVPRLRDIRHSLNIASRDELRITLSRSSVEGFATPETLWSEILTQEQVDERIREERTLVAAKSCGETFYYQLVRIDWQGEFQELEEFRLLSPLCEPQLQAEALPPDRSKARISWNWEGSRASFDAYRIYVGRDEETLWANPNPRLELDDFEQTETEVELRCGTNFVGLRIDGADTLTVRSEIVTVLGRDCPPGVPSIMQVRRGDDPRHELVIDWSWGESEISPARFRVEYEKRGSPQNEEVEGSQRSATIRNLRCNQSYDFAVLAVSSGGTLSEPSETVSGSTGPCPPPTSPTHLAITRWTETSAKLTWSWSDGSAVPTGFRVEVEGVSNLGGDVPPGDMASVLTNLACNREYKIKVVARGSGGSTASDWLTYTHSCRLPVPTHVRVQPGEPSNSSLILSWDYDNHPLHQSFLVECNDPAVTEKTVEASGRQLLLGNLSENRTFKFRVKAIAGQDDLSSPFSEYVAGSTSQRKLPAILSIPGNYETLSDAILAVNRASPSDLEQPGQPVTLSLEPNGEYTLVHIINEEGLGYSSMRFNKSTVIEGNNAKIQFSSTYNPNAIVLDQPGIVLTLRNVTIDAGSLQALDVTQGTLIIEGSTIVSNRLTCANVRQNGRLIVRDGSRLLCTNSSEGPRRSLIIKGSTAKAEFRTSELNQTIQAKDGAHLILIDTAVTGDPESGVILRSAAGGVIEGGIIKGGSYGVILNNPGEVTIQNCEITGREGVGIYCEDVGARVHIDNVRGTKYGCP